MTKFGPLSLIAASLLCLTPATVCRATESENLGMRALPAPAHVEVDGKINDWDLSGGVFICGDVENARSQSAVWLHLMYDADNLYVLAHWIDSTPMNNPGVVAGDQGFAGDCLQFRTLAAGGTPNERGAHFTCWRGRDGKDAIDVAFGIKFDGGHISDAKTQGAHQAFLADPDGKGYIQELSIPWKLLTKDGQPIKAGGAIVFTCEPNFTVERSGRLTYKDIFKPNITLDRVFTFMNSPEWGIVSLVPRGNVIPQPVRLSDAREFAVKMQDGAPQIDWTGLIKSRELPGFKPVTIQAPEDGYVSLLIKDGSGTVVRELVNAEFVSKGAHTYQWDGLSTPNWRDPGQAVTAGTYTASALFHTGIHLRLNGWACNGGNAPWDSADGKGNWGGDHGVPVAAVTAGDRVYLGWSAAEAGRSLLACDLKGNVQWSLTHGGIAGASALAIDASTHTLYSINDTTLFRVDSATGIYTTWAGSGTTDLALKEIFGSVTQAGKNRISLAIVNHKLVVASMADDAVAVVDAENGKLIKKFTVKSPAAISAGPAGDLLIVSNSSVLSTDLTENPRELIRDVNGASAITTGPDGMIYVGVTDPDNQVKLYRAGELQGTIGKQGGRALLGKWTPEGMRAIHSLAVDSQGALWVAEADGSPKRVSVWNTKDKSFIREFFGSTGYGALGGAIDPVDPTIMVGQGCEWKIDPTTGRAACVGVISRDDMSVSRFRVGANGKLHLFVAPTWAFNRGPLRIYERLGPADYRLRSEVFYTDAEGNELKSGNPAKAAQTRIWSDEVGSGIRKPGAFSTSAMGELRFSGWYMDVDSTLSLRSEDKRYVVTGYTTVGAPQYDLSKPGTLPAKGFSSADGKFCLQNGEYGVSHGWMTCYDTATGKALWKYPDTFVGVHGSHNAPPGERGLIRGSYNPCDSVKLPDPIGNVWIIPTNVGEWHIITEKGFYLTPLFQEDPLKVQFPEQALPGAVMDSAPCGMGGEDFGGSATLGKDGKLYLQAGKTGFWNVTVQGLETARTLPAPSIEITPPDVQQAQAMREEQLQKKSTALSIAIRHQTPGDFTGNIGKDFNNPKFTEFQKQPDAAVKTALAYDDKNLYVAWDVADNTPWINGATDAEMMYIGGDTVDLQIGNDPQADRNRAEAGQGDLRLSIGNFRGTPRAMLYRRVTDGEKKPRTFSSGVIKAFEMDYVAPLDEIRIKVTPRAKGYIVEAAIPLSALQIKPTTGLTIRGDLGVTHGDQAGQRTRLRTYWSNQHTGIVDDVVFELKMEPKNWGALTFE